MARKTTAAKAQKGKCDVLFSKIIRARGACQYCGKSQNLQCAHILSRRFANTRCDESNALCLCAGCHHLFTDHPVSFGQWVMTDIMSPDAYLELVAEAHTMKKVDWSEMHAYLLVRGRELDLV